MQWQRLRFALGVAQMTGAALAVLLLVTTGVSRETLYAVTLTSLITATSMLLRGRRSG